MGDLIANGALHQRRGTLQRGQLLGLRRHWRLPPAIQVTVDALSGYWQHGRQALPHHARLFGTPGSAELHHIHAEWAGAAIGTLTGGTILAARAPPPWLTGARQMWRQLGTRLARRRAVVQRSRHPASAINITGAGGNHADSVVVAHICGTIAVATIACIIVAAGGGSGYSIGQVHLLGRTILECVRGQHKGSF